MKAAVLKALGSPLAVETVPDPVLGTGEVIVDVAATKVLAYAGEVLSGQRRYLLEPPVIPGAGCIGRVREVGPDATELAGRFTDAHHARYGHSNPNERIEVVNLRVAALGAGDPLPGEPLPAGAAPAPDAVVEAVFGSTPLATPLYSRASLGTGTEVDGPCIVLEEGCTTLVPPGWIGTTTPDGHLLLERV